MAASTFSGAALGEATRRRANADLLYLGDARQSEGVPRANSSRHIALLGAHPPGRVRLYVAAIRRYDDHVLTTGRYEYLTACSCAEYFEIASTLRAFSTRSARDCTCQMLTPNRNGFICVSPRPFCSTISEPYRAEGRTLDPRRRATESTRIRVGVARRIAVKRSRNSLSPALILGVAPVPRPVPFD